MTVDHPLLARQILVSAGVSNVRTRTPDAPATPLVRLEDAGGEFSPSTSPDWRYTADLQLDVWHDTRADAHTLWADCRTALLAAPRTDPTHAAGVVTLVEFGGRQWLPDEDFRTGSDHPTPRFVTIVRISAHPNPA